LLKQKPFEITRIGWGIFTIEVTLNFKSQLGRPAMTLHHCLSFSSDKTEKEYSVVLDSRKLNQNLKEVEAK